MFKQKRAQRGISNKQFGCGRTGHGDHRPTMICKAIYSPLQRGGGSRAPRGAGMGLLLEPFLHKYTEMNSCCERLEITI